MKLLLVLSSIALASASTFLTKAGECPRCLTMANSILGSSCKDTVCAVKAFASKKDQIMNSEDGPMQMMAIYGCAQQDKCDLMPAENAAVQLHLITADALPTQTGGQQVKSWFLQSLVLILCRND